MLHAVSCSIEWRSRASLQPFFVSLVGEGLAERCITTVRYPFRPIRRRIQCRRIARRRPSNLWRRASQS